MIIIPGREPGPGRGSGSEPGRADSEEMVVILEGVAAFVELRGGFGFGFDWGNRVNGFGGSG